jgi:hypothetical protein
MATSKNTANVPAFAVIKATEVKVAPRGRKAAPLNDALVAAMRELGPDDAIDLTGLFGLVNGKDRQGVTATIKRHWLAARGPASVAKIDYGTEGTPQVREDAKKTAALASA